MPSMSSCLLPAWFAAASGLADPIALKPPVGVGSVVSSASEKIVSGGRLAHWADSENFTVQWTDDAIDSAVALAAISALEAAWSVLVVDEGWGVPTSGDTHKIWVILDGDLEGTGLTTGLPNAAFPEGVAVLYLNPEYAEFPDFFASVCAHEFGHALQFRERDWYTSDASEAWYWEATAEWMAEVVDPSTNQAAYSSAWYAQAPGAAYDSVEGYHAYGMMLLNAYLAEFEIGNRGLWSIWLENEGMDWLTEIERATGVSSAEVWGDFAGAYIAQGLEDAEFFEYPILEPSAVEIPGELGQAYIALGSITGSVTLSAGIGTIVRDGKWQVFSGAVDIPQGAGDVILAVTNPLAVPLSYSLTFGPSTVPPSEENPDAEDIGADAAVGDPPQKKGTGCTSTGMRATGGWLLGCAILGIRCRGTASESL